MRHALARREPSDWRGLAISNAVARQVIIDAVIAANPKSAAEFCAGKDKAFNALAGQVMNASTGKANPAQVNELLAARLA